MGTVMFLIAWMAVGIFLTAYLAGVYEWPDPDDLGDGFIYLLAAVAWPIVLLGWALIIPAQRMFVLGQGRAKRQKEKLKQKS